MSLADEVPIDIAPPPEAAAELEPLAAPDDWMSLADEVPADIAPPPEAAAEPEPLAAPDDWMSLADEVPVEVTPPLEAEETQPFEPIAELDEAWVDVAARELPEGEAPPLPAWAAAEAIEAIVDGVATGPDWVLLSEEEEAQVRTMEPEPVAPPPPTWVALEPEVKAPPAAKKAPPKRRAPKADDDHQARLEQARKLWSAGQREQACAEYERLIKSPLLDDVIVDLEKITGEGLEYEPALRLLGDAYMRDNRLSDALAAYRHALSSL
jgi:tetratricopeptide (TPR) repeat protein